LKRIAITERPLGRKLPLRTLFNEKINLVGEKQNGNRWTLFS